MAALNIAHELLTLKHEAIEEAFNTRLKVLQEKIDGVLARESKTQASEMLEETML